MRSACLVLADCVTNVAITGRGVIDANGKSFVREKTGDWTGWQFERIVDPTKSMPRVCFFVGCRGVRVEDVTLVNGPAGWSYWVHDCDDVLFDRCRVKVDVRYPNNDGIHINSSRDVMIRNCDLETGDDSIIVRANNRSLAENKVCERVVVSNCTMRSWSAGIRIGWANDGVIRNCTFRKCGMNGSPANLGALTVKTSHDVHPGTDPAGVHRDIRILGCRFTNCGNSGVFVSSTDGVQVKGNTFSRCSIRRSPARRLTMRSNRRRDRPRFHLKSHGVHSTET